MYLDPFSSPDPSADAARPAERAASPHAVDLGRDVCANLAESLRREWLVTNGIGGYAMGTVAGANVRRYHGLLVAATKPPAVRTMVLSKLEERLVVRGTRHDLSTNLWTDGTCAPRGFLHCARFRLERGLPTWRWEVDGCTLEKRIAMTLGENAVLVEYRLLPGSPPCELHLEALVSNRSHHALHPRPGFDAEIERVNGAVRVRLVNGGQGGVADDLWLHCPEADASLPGERRGVWWRDLDLPVERERGYDDRDSLLHAATLVARMSPGQRVTFGACLGLPLSRPPQLLFVAEQARRQAFLESAGLAKASPPLRELALMADQCVVRRPVGQGGAAHEGWSVIAGYPWFADWSRDTMIALPGLFLRTRRHPAARGVLETYARRLSAGMLPNRFPDRDEGGPESLEYNAVDAPLLFVRAVGLTQDAAPDDHWFRSMWPAVRAVIDAFVRGTRHGIRVDDADGLLRAGEPGQQLTWMDAKVDGRVVTPRMGKPVEVNALWYQALVVATAMAKRFGGDADADADAMARLAEKARAGFDRFWNPAAECLFDVIDTPEGGPDPSVRPNQILAAGLEHVALSPERAAAVARCVARRLLVPAGLRTLDPADPRHRPRYEGDVVRRDEAYHQGTAWPWLLPFLARAWRRAGGDEATIEGIRAALVAHLSDAGLGGVSEIVDSAPPHEPRGCPVQAWSVAAALELLLGEAGGDEGPTGRARQAVGAGGMT